MASIDKIYTDSYAEYKEFKDWADAQRVTFYDGYSLCVGDWVWRRCEADFANGSIPIANTPQWMDAYLVQNCKCQFVLDRLKYVYSEETYSELATVDLSAGPPADYQQNRKIKIMRYEKSKYPIHSKPYFGGRWWLENCLGYWYNSTTQVWVYKSYYPIDTNIAHIKSIKGVIRHLRKQFLPKGEIFILSGRCVGEEYLVKVK